MGLDGGWPASNREAGAVSLREAWDASWWISVTGFVVLAATLEFAPDLYYWLLPVCVPLMAAPLLIRLTSKRFDGSALFTSDGELDPPAILAEQRAILAGWRNEPLVVEPLTDRPQPDAIVAR
jgi:membrane glycosyltransferase